MFDHNSLLSKDLLILYFFFMFVFNFATQKFSTRIDDSVTTSVTQKTKRNRNSATYQ